MPSVDVAMARSLRGGVWGSIAESLDMSLAPRAIGDGVKDKATEVKTAFSSWDNCMEATYCKYVGPLLRPSLPGHHREVRSLANLPAVSQMASYRRHHYRQPYPLLRRLVYSPVLLLRCVLLLRMLRLPKVLRQLHGLLRYSGGQASQIPRQ